MLNLLLSNALAFFVLTILANALLEIRDFSKYKHLLLYVVFVVFITLINGENVNPCSTIRLSIGYFIYLLCNYKARLLKIAIIYLSFIVFNAFGEILSGNICNLFFDLKPSDISTLHYSFAIILSQFFNYCFVVLEIKIIRFSYWGDLPKYIYLIIILPVTTILLLVSVNVKYYYILFREERLFILILLGLLISNFVVFFVFLKTVNAINLKKEFEIMKLEKKSLDYKYELLNAQHKANYSFMHDSIRSCMKIQSLLDKGEYGQFKDELLRLNKSMLKRFNMINSNLSVVSPIINFKLKDILEKNIDFKSVIEYNDFTFLDIYAQRSIFDILVDIGMLRQGSHDKPKEVILKEKKLNRHVLIQLLTTHEDIQSTDEFTSLYEKLSDIVHNCEGEISFEILDNKSDSLVILFNV